MKRSVSDIIMAPKFLRCETESLRLLLTETQNRLPGHPIIGRIKETIAKREKEADEIDQCLQSIEDPFIKEIVQAYRTTGSWNQANIQVYNYPSYHCCRSAVRRYFEKTGLLQRFR